MGWSVSSGNDGQFAPELGGQFDRIFHLARACGGLWKAFFP
jgi:hypothetical protein